jgi:geranylgeranyl transferase type-2 subunit alpha
MCALDPALPAQTIVPNLTDSERLNYILTETDAIEDILEVATDCKWVYQALVNCTTLASKIEGVLSHDAKMKLLRWLDELIRLDPMRKERWLDFRKSLGDLSSQ